MCNSEVGLRCVEQNKRDFVEIGCCRKTERLPNTNCFQFLEAKDTRTLHTYAHNQLNSINL